VIGWVHIPEVKILHELIAIFFFNKTDDHHLFGKHLIAMSTYKRKISKENFGPVKKKFFL